MAKTWLITGVSGGFGRLLVEELVQAGETVVGTLRQDAQIEAFNNEFAGRGATAIKMDVTDAAQVKAGVDAVIAQHGRIDVLINNAGYGFLGAVEEVSDAEARQQMDTNLFGALDVTRNVLPHMRRQQSGCIVQLSSVAGWIGGPGFGIYNASKFALNGWSEALAAEVAPLGIKVLVVAPGPFRTQFAGTSLRVAEQKIDAYAETAHARINWMESINGTQAGDPLKAAQVMIQAVNDPKSPLHLPLGNNAVDRILARLQTMEKEIRDWEAITRATDFPQEDAA